MGLMLAASASATINFPASDVQFWVGTGSNSAVVVIAWDDCTPATALAWGVRWNGTTTALGLIDSIQAHDSRFSNGSTATVNGAVYNDGTLILSSSTNWWCYTVNGQWASVGYSGYTMSNGDIMELSATCDFDMTTAVAATDPNASTTPVEATIAFSDILYWVGTGSNEAVMAVNWADTALAWGFRWDGSATVEDMMAAIAAADPRFDYSGSGWLNDITFNDGTVSLAGTPGNYWGSTNNGVMDMGMSQTLANGNFEKWADPAAGVAVDSSYDATYGWWYTYVYPMTIHPVSVPDATPVVEATIAASDILYWVGTGSNEAILAVNWADTALAWGFRWDGSATVEDMMAAIAAADPRFDYSGSGWLNDITFNDGTVSLAGTPGNYWGSTNNGVMDMGMSQTLANGNFEKWADPAAGVAVDSSYDATYGWWYTYVYPMTIHPVSIPHVPGPFCGPVGTEGCDAIDGTSNAIVAWATACTVVRGPQDIAVANSPLAGFGNESLAVGPAGTSTSNAVSLGDGGSATLTFAKPIVNGNGPDFAVFENAIRNNTTGGYFLELAFVEVSSDGERFVRFPATSLTPTATQVGSFGEIDPTYINNLAGKYEVGYGTPFDLEELADSTGIDINNITHVRVVDVIGTIDPQYATYDAFGHIVNDPYPTNFNSGGFDLTGVAVLHQSEEGVDEVETVAVRIAPNPASSLMTVSGAAGSMAVIYDMTGREVVRQQMVSDRQQLNIAHLDSGIYMLRIDGMSYKIVKQ